MKNKTYWLLLSYTIEENAPSYGNGFGIQINADKSINDGDSCNQSKWLLSNHFGTHVDSPLHFDSKGSPIDNYAPDFWVFDYVSIVDISPIENGHLIGKKEILTEFINSKTEILIIKTGYCDCREDEKYWRNNPGILPDLADALALRCPNIRAIGFDLISISSYVHRDKGREAHKNFLCRDKPICIIEDMNLRQIKHDTVIQRLIVSPLRVKNTDGAPCTIFAEMEI